MGFDITPGFNLGISDAFRSATPSFGVQKGKTVVTSVQSSNNAKRANQSSQPGTQKGATTSSGAYSGQVRGASTSSGGGGGGVDPASLALFDAGISGANNSLGQLDRQQQIGLENIANSFNSSLNKLLGSKAIADRNYSTTKTQSTQDNIKARNDINASVGRNANAIQRLLGQRGAGNSSAAQVVAPYGAALQGTQQLRGVTDAFGRNMQALDTSYGDFNRDWQSSREDLDRQRYSNENSLRADVATKRSSLLSNLAQLQAQRAGAAGGGAGAAMAAAQPYLSQVNALQGQITDYGRQYANPINVNSPTYEAPDLQQYDVEQGAGPSVQNQSAFTDTISPTLYALLFGKRNQQNEFAF